MEYIDFVFCVVKQLQWSKILDVLYKISIMLIATANFIFAKKIFSHNDKKDDEKTENEHRIRWLSTLVLDHNLKNFYEFFDMLEANLKRCKSPDLKDEDKISINNDIADNFIFLRRNFIDLLLAIDKSLYDRVLSSCDSLQDDITKKIIDDGINLSHEPKFNECFDEITSTTKTKIIKALFNYRG